MEKRTRHINNSGYVIGVSNFVASAPCKATLNVVINRQNNVTITSGSYTTTGTFTNISFTAVEGDTYTLEFYINNACKNTFFQVDNVFISHKEEVNIEAGNFIVSGGYRYGFNGQERDDEIKGKGNSYDFGARMYDPRVGRWLSIDPLASKYPDWSTYRAMLNNPLIFIDPDGETEFYYKGKWIGTDGVDNNVVAKVTNRKVKRQIKRHTRKGLNYEMKLKLDTPIIDNDKMSLINRDILEYSYFVLELSLSDEGKVGEYSTTLEEFEQNQFKPTQELSYKKGDKNKLPRKGSISIHSHTTGENVTGYLNAGVPSKDKSDEPGDESAFKNFDFNIIVGLNGIIEKYYFETTNELKTIDNRFPAINIFDNTSLTPIITFTREDAIEMLSTEPNRLKNRYERKNNINSKNKPSSKPAPRF